MYVNLHMCHVCTRVVPLSNIFRNTGVVVSQNNTKNFASNRELVLKALGPPQKELLITRSKIRCLLPFARLSVYFGR